MKTDNEAEQWAPYKLLDLQEILFTRRLTETLFKQLANADENLMRLQNEPMLYHCFEQAIGRYLLMHRGALFAHYLRDVCPEDWNKVWASFHTLWGQAKEAPNYKKNQWLDLQAVLADIMESRGTPPDPKTRPARNREEAQLIHDTLIAVCKGEVDVGLSPASDQIAGMMAQIDVLCWVLGCEHNKTFQHNIDGLQKEITKRGYVISDAGKPVSPNARP